jgi:hypothetical protein
VPTFPAARKAATAVCPTADGTQPDDPADPIGSTIKAHLDV